MRRRSEPIGERRFAEGDRFYLCGQAFRVVRGKKPVAPPHHDLRLDWWSPQFHGWVPISMDVVFMMVDFFTENEHVLYPPPRYEGGGKLISEMWGAFAHGWEAAAEKLQGERSNRATRLFPDGTPAERGVA